MSTKLCLHCNTLFTVIPARMERAKFCSRACKSLYRYGIAPNATEQRTCKVCGASFESKLHSAEQHVTCSPACAAIARSRRETNKTQRICQVCGVTFTTFPSRIGLYCSRACAHRGIAQRSTGSIRSSTMVNCDYCGKPRKLYQSRQKSYVGNFCNMQCYLASSQSGIERKLAAWLDSQQIPYQRQYKLGRRTVDFWIANTVVEVNGCYWHVCADCGFTARNESQQRRIVSDAKLHQYCLARNIPLLTIWEHDINQENYTALTTVTHRP